MSKDRKIQTLIKEELKSESSKEKYLNILGHRIDDNRKSIGKHFLVLLVTALAFPLLMEAKIAKISIGPLRVVDTKIALFLVPIIFSFTYYKYLMIWLDLAEQKRTFKLLTAELFGIEVKSFLNDRLNPFSLIDSINKHHSQSKLDSIGFIAYSFGILAGFILILFPFAFEFYLVKEIYEVMNPASIFEWICFISPIFFGVLTVLMLIQAIRNDFKKI